jgi:uncharacterized membrane protein
MSAALAVLTGVAAVGSATVGGVFYAFSTFVMPGLRRLPPATGTAAMQQINITAVRPGLMTALFGTAAVCAAVGVWSVVSWQPGRSLLLISGAASYLIGAVGVTAGYHVPLNNALATLDPAAPATAGSWQDYLGRWTAGNHVRTAASMVSAAFFLGALALGEEQVEE